MTFHVEINSICKLPTHLDLAILIAHVQAYNFLICELPNRYVLYTTWPNTVISCKFDLYSLTQLMCGCVV